MRDTVIRWGIRQCECESGWKSPAYCCLLSCLNSAPATTTEEEKSVNRVTTPLRCSHRCSSRYPLSQATGPGLQVSFWRTHEKEAENPARHNKLSKWQLILVLHNTPPHKKRKKKKRTTQNCCRLFLASSGKAGGQWGFLEVFFLSPDTHSACPFFERGGTATCLHCGRQLWSAAGGPAGTAEHATCSGEFVWKPAGWASADQGEDEAKHSWQTRHAHSLTHSHSLTTGCLLLHQLFFPPCAPFLPAGVWNHTLIAHSSPSDRHCLFFCVPQVWCHH